MTLHYQPMAAPVPLAEIENKLPHCSMFCPLYADCPHRVTLHTVDEYLCIDVCTYPAAKAAQK